VGKQIATEAMELSHKLKVSDNVKAACVLGRVLPSYEFMPRFSLLTVG
jgi:hypothetical protein